MSGNLDVRGRWYGQPDQLDWQSQKQSTPLDHLMEAEEIGLQLSQEAKDEVRVETLNAMLDQFLDSWMHGNCSLEIIAKKVLSVAKYVGHRSVADWSLASLAAVTGETKAAVSKRIYDDCASKVEACGSSGQAPFQQSKARRNVQSAALTGNACTKGGKKLPAKIQALKSLAKNLNK